MYIAPVITVLTSPTAIRVYIVVGATVTTYVVARAAEETIRDRSAETAARDIHQSRDPKDFAEHEKNRKSRFTQNVKVAGHSVGHCVVDVLKVTVWPVKTASSVQRKHRFAKADEKLKKHPYFETVEGDRDAVPEADREEFARWQKAEAKVSSAVNRNTKIESWWDKDRRTPGQRYLAEELSKVVDRNASVETLAVRAIYSVLFENFVQGISIDLSTDHSRQATGARLFVKVDDAFTTEEMEMIRHDVLRPWLEYRGPLTPSGWLDVAQGWDQAAQVKTEATAAGKE